MLRFVPNLWNHRRQTDWCDGQPSCRPASDLFDFRSGNHALQYGFVDTGKGQCHPIEVCPLPMPLMSYRKHEIEAGAAKGMPGMRATQVDLIFATEPYVVGEITDDRKRGP